MAAVKPLWAAGPEAIDPDWLWAWDGLGHLGVYDGGVPFDMVGGVFASNFTAWDYVLRPEGRAVQRDNGSDRLYWNARDEFQLHGDIPFSIAVAVYGHFNDGGGVFSARDNTDNGMWELIAGNDDSLDFQFRESGTQRTVTWTSIGLSSTTSAPSTWQYAMLVMTREPGGTFRLWINGVDFGTQTNATTPAASRAHRLEVGRRGNSASDLLGDYLVTYVWQRQLSEGEALQLSADPFGPIRPALWHPYMADAGAGGTDRRAQLSWAELELPDAPRKARVSWAEMEVPTAPRTVQLAWTELEIPTAPRTAQLSWAEFEVPTAPRKAQLSWTELEMPSATRAVQLVWTELELPDAPRKVRLAWTELEVGSAPRAARLSWAEMETADAPRRVRLAWTEVELPDAPRRAQVAWAEMEVPDAPRAAQVAWAELEVPDFPNRAARVAWAELSLPDAPGGGGSRANRLTLLGHR